MGFFDKVRDVLTSSDAERDRASREPAPSGTAPASSPPAPAEEFSAPTTAPQPASSPTDPPASAPTAGAAATTATPPSGAPATTPAGTGEEAAATRSRTHTVQRGDTLASIAAEHGVDAEEMARLNGIDNPDLIYPGQVFRVPTT